MWVERKRLYEDRSDEFGKAIAAGDKKPQDETGAKRIVHPSVAEGARSLLGKLAPGLWYLSDAGPGNDHHREILPGRGICLQTCWADF